MIRPLIRKAGKVPKEAGLDARVGAAGDENGEAGEVSTKRCAIGNTVTS